MILCKTLFLDTIFYLNVWSSLQNNLGCSNQKAPSWQPSSKNIRVSAPLHVLSKTWINKRGRACAARPARGCSSMEVSTRNEEYKHPFRQSWAWKGLWGRAWKPEKERKIIRTERIRRKLSRSAWTWGKEELVLGEFHLGPNRDTKKRFTSAFTLWTLPGNPFFPLMKGVRTLTIKTHTQIHSKNTPIIPSEQLHWVQYPEESAQTPQLSVKISVKHIVSPEVQSRHYSTLLPNRSKSAHLLKKCLWIPSFLPPPSQ